MLIRFHSKAGSFTIQGDIGTALLRLMGMSGEVPGAVLAQDVPRALERLKQGAAAGKSAAEDPASDEEEAGNRVSLATRAFPLVQLLEAAGKRNCDVIWEELKKSTG
jgi:hypothetical protein